MKDDQQNDIEYAPIFNLEKIPALEEQNGPNFNSDDEEDEPELKPQQVQSRPSRNTHLIPQK